MAAERELEKSDMIKMSNMVFDETSIFSLPNRGWGKSW